MVIEAHIGGEPIWNLGGVQLAARGSELGEVKVQTPVNYLKPHGACVSGSLQRRHCCLWLEEENEGCSITQYSNCQFSSDITPRRVPVTP